MASWALVRSPWTSLVRLNFRWDIVTRTRWQFKTNFSASIHYTDTPGWEGLKSHRYPSRSIDHSVFEDISDDYDAVARSSAVPTAPRSSTETLILLVGQGKYEDADRIRAELLELGVEIKPDYVYEEAAKCVLQWPNPQNHVTTFANWLALLPSAQHSGSRSFDEIRNFLFTSPETNMPLIVRFGLICASKGYVNMVEKEVLPVVAQFADPAITAQFLGDFEAEVSRYAEGASPRSSASPLRGVGFTAAQRVIKEPLGSLVAESSHSPGSCIPDKPSSSPRVHDLALPLGPSSLSDALMTTNSHHPLGPVPVDVSSDLDESGSSVVVHNTDQVALDALPMSLSTRSKSAPPIGSSVFEDIPDDYAEVVTEFASLNTSDLSLQMAEDSRVAEMLTELSSVGSIFEDVTEEYIAIAGESASAGVPHSSTQALLRLVASGKFEEADGMLAELSEVGVKIPPSRVYERAAQASLRQSDPQQQIDGFTKWFSLLPESHKSKPRTFDETRELIFLAPATNMMLIIRFGIICASKGYANVVYRQVIPPVMRYADPSVSSRFLEEFQAANNLYWVKLRPHSASFVLRSSAKAYRGLAARTLAMASRLEEAIDLLPTEDELSKGTILPLSPNTYDVLLTRLRQKKPRQKEDAAKIQLIQRLLTFALNFNYGDLDSLESPVQDAQMADNFTSGPTEHFGGDLVASIRSIKRSIASGNPPHCFTLVDFIDAYLATGRAKALTLLRAKAVRSSYRSTSAWVFSEMLYYRRQGLHELVVMTFTDHFYLTGIPRDEILSRLEQWSVLQKPGMEKLRQDRASVVHARRGKVWPSPIHCALVWHSLVALTSSLHSLERLYQKLLQYAEGQPAEQRFDPNAPGYSNTSPLLPPPSWKHKVDSAAFTPFIRGFNVQVGPSRGARVLSDMLRVGIEPTVYQFTELAGRYARFGDVQRAFLILDRMERENKFEEVPQPGMGGGMMDATLIVDNEEREEAIAKSRVEENEWEGNEVVTPSRPVTRPLGLDFPPPNVVMYTSLMRGFVDAKSLAGALEVERRMRQRSEYTPGADPHLDNVYALLRILQHEVGEPGDKSHDEFEDMPERSLKLTPATLTSTYMDRNQRVD